MNAEELQKKYRKFRLLSWIYTLLGLGLAIGGVYRFIFLNASYGTNLKTQLPQINNGSASIVIGLLFFIIGVYQLLQPATAFKGEIESWKAMRDQFKRKKRRD